MMSTTESKNGITKGYKNVMMLKLLNYVKYIFTLHVFPINTMITPPLEVKSLNSW